MIPLNLSKQFLSRLIFQIFHSCLAIVCILWLAVFLQSGKSGLHLFVLNDLMTETDRLAFVVSFPIAYLFSLFALAYTLKIPRFDFFNRILAINIIAYGGIGLALSALRLPLYSREVFIFELLCSSALLISYYLLCHRLFPKCLGVLNGIDITPFTAYPMLEAVRTNNQSIHGTHFDAIAANLRGNIDDSTSRLLFNLAQQRIPFYDSNALIELLWGRIPLTDLTTVDIEAIRPSSIYGLVKRISEITLIVILSPILAGISIIIAIAIKLDSPGPILFSQTRTGLNGKPFTMLKFRSMFLTDISGSRFAKKDDKRITRVGWILRRIRFDELPQIWNVIVGDMSLIGPRPEQLEFTRRFNQLIPFYSFRHTIRPGITGWAQVMYGYAASDQQTSAKLEFDFFYLKHLSAWLDLVVVVKTIRTIILGSGAR